MATEFLNLSIRTKGAGQATKKIGALGNSAKKAGSALTAFKSAFAIVIGARAIQSFGNTIDTINQLENRLRVVTDSTQEMNQVWGELSGVAQRSRAGFQETVDLFARVALTQDDLGVSTGELIDLTEKVGKAISASGATAVEAKAGLIQFSQSLARGVLRGDEFRSVLEQIPIVADVIAREIGVARGGLIDYAEQGKLSSDLILQAFRNQEEFIERMFNETIPTLGQAFEKIQTSITQFVRDFDDGAKISDLLRNTMLGLNETMINAGDLAVELGERFRALFQILVDSQKNSLSGRAILLSIRLVDGLRISFNDVIITLAQLVDFSRRTFNAMGAGAREAGLIIQETFFLLREDISGLFTSIREFVGPILDVAVSLARVLGGTAAQIIGKLKEEFDGAVTSSPLLSAAAELGTRIGGAITDGFNAPLENSTEVAARKILMSRKLTQALDLVSAAYGGGKRALDLYANGTGVSSAATNAARKEAEEFAKKLRKVRFELDEVAAAENELEETTLFLFEALKRGAIGAQEFDNLTRLLGDKLRPTLDATAFAAEQFRNSIEDAFRRDFTEPQKILEIIQEVGLEMAEAGEITMSQYVSAMRNAEIETLAFSRAADDGARRALLGLADAFTDASTAAEIAVTTSFQTMEDALVDFIATGKFEIEDFVDTIIREFARLAVQQAILGPIASLFSNIPFFGNSSSGKVTANAKGNVVNSPTFFSAKNGLNVAGEKGPEAILPLARGSNGQLGVQTVGGRSGSVTINAPVTVNVTTQGGSPQQIGDEVASSVQRAVENEVAAIVQNVLANESRPGGMLRGIST